MTNLADELLKNVEWLEVKRGGYSRSSSTDYARVSYSENKASGRTQLVLTLYTPLMEQLGWKGGDRVKVGVTDKHFVLKRTLQGGSRLSPTATAAKTAKELTGVSTKSTVCVAMGDVKDHIIRHGVDKHRIIIGEGPIVFLPKKPQ